MREYDLIKVELVWDNQTDIVYSLDPGPLGMLDHSAAAVLTSEALQVWEDMGVVSFVLLHGAAPASILPPRTRQR